MVLPERFWGFAATAFLALMTAAVHPGCRIGGTITCPTREHPGHIDDLGEPDPCCLGYVPCCSNPLWNRKAVLLNGALVDDPCCLSTACPGWDPNKGDDAGTDAAMPPEETDSGTSPMPDAGPPEDAGTDGG